MIPLLIKIFNYYSLGYICDFIVYFWKFYNNTDKKDDIGIKIKTAPDAGYTVKVV